MEAIASRLEATASRLQAIASSLEAIASRLLTFLCPVWLALLLPSRIAAEARLGEELSVQSQSLLALEHVLQDLAQQRRVSGLALDVAICFKSFAFALCRLLCYLTTFRGVHRHS